MLRKHLVEVIVGVVVAVLGAAVLAWLKFGGPEPASTDPDLGSSVADALSSSAPPASGSPAPTTGPSAEESTAAPQSAGTGLRPTSRLLYDDGANRATVTGLEVTTEGKLRVRLRYQSSAANGWSLSCPEPAADLRSSRLTLAGGKQVYPVDTYCTSQRPGEDFTLRSGAVLESWGVFPVVPPSGSEFSLTWYDLGTVEGLKL
ncbi:hypothetical protein [Micromonospora sp. WMMD987]|jgi:hypothetical protein|uniref:hypothetical protein n=1 Tax=Micromonospora sp. WMMD987 TaxID=3016089 RepID=UPI00249C4460|nr:hypothetical protein [Micromonospora sp. WMMD987]WFE94228.1 hypothetical protein O7612_23065 [Micromonospora sp. WMMD987]